MVNPGLLALSITRGITFSSVILQCKDEKVTVTGTLNPNVTGLYTVNGTFNGFQLYIVEGTPSYFLYVNPTYAKYVISPLLSDGALTAYWTQSPVNTADPTGTYNPQGTATGVATVTDNPVNLTGFTPEAHVRRTPKSTEVLLDLAPTITDPINGQVTIPAMLPSVTDVIAFTGNFAWDLVFFELISGDRFGPFVGGPFTINDNITQDVAPP